MARPKDIDEAAEFAIVFESVAKTEAKNKGEPPKRVRAVTMDLGEQKGGTIVDGDAVEVHPPKEMFKGQKKGPPRKPDTQNGDTTTYPNQTDHNGSIGRRNGSPYWTDCAGLSATRTKAQTIRPKAYGRYGNGLSRTRFVRSDWPRQ